jgi:hypothetical protein
MTLENKIAGIFNLTDEKWMKHANPLEREDQILRIAPDCDCLLEPGLVRMVVFLADNRVINLDVL